MMKRFSFDQGFAAIATVAVISGIVAGFWVIGTPGWQRLISADRQRLQGLQSIARKFYWNAQDKNDYQLPETLPKQELDRDPLTNQPYEYRRLTETTYQLCAEFSTDSSRYPLPNRPRNGNEEAWTHPQGRHCFDFDVTEQSPLLEGD